MTHSSFRAHRWAWLCCTLLCFISTAASAQDEPSVSATAEAQEDPWAAGPYGAGFDRARAATSQFKLDIGGHIKLDSIFDSQQIDSDLPFFALPTQVVESGATGDVLVDNTKADTTQFNLAARELLLRFGVATPNYGDWSAGAYIEFNFLGFIPGNNAGSPSPILRHGYATLTNSATNTTLLFGQAQGPFGPIDPQTVNWETYVLMGDIFSRLPQVRLTQAFGDVSLAVAAVRPADYSNDGQRGYDVVGRGQDATMPELQARVGYTLPMSGHYWFFDSPGAVGLSGRYARERFNAGTTAEEDVASWTVALDATVPIGPLTLQGELYYGANTDNVYGLSGIVGTLDADGIFDPGEEITEFGGWALLGWTINKRWYTSVIYGRIQPDKDAFSRPDVVPDNGFDIQHNQSLTANVYFRILPTLYVAAEYVFLNTRYWNRLDGNTDGVETEGTLHRGQLALHFTF